MKGFVLPRSNAERNAPSYDGMYDPLGDEEVLSPEKRGSLLKDTNGRLYYPTTGGYGRVKTINDIPVTKVQTTTDDTAVLYSGEGFSNGAVKSNKFYTAYQNSGGPLTLTFYQDAGKTIPLFSQVIATATWTALGCANYEFGTVYSAWSAAAGAIQKIAYVAVYNQAVPTV